MCQAEWRELESDPGLFTLLVEDFGVSGVQVEEVYDLSRPITEVVYGFIFLFRWDNSKKKTGRRAGRSSAGSTTSLSNNGIALYTSTGTVSTLDGPRTLGSIQKDQTLGCKRSTSGYTSDGQPSSDTQPTDFLCNTPSADSNHAFSESANELFFARQMIQNSCATHALLSVLLNRPELDVGPMLREFYRATRCLSPEAKGTAIGSMPHLARAHNRHAAQPMSSCIEPSDSSTFIPDPPEAAAIAVSIALAAMQSTPSSSVSALDSSVGLVSSTTGINGTSQMDTFHFVSYVPFGGYLYELDSLKPIPINHGPLRDPNNQYGWTEQCACILRQRMQEQDVRYSLMAVVPDRRLRLTKRIATLNRNRQIIEETLLQRALFEATHENSPALSMNGPGRSLAASPASDSGLMTHPTRFRPCIHPTGPIEALSKSRTVHSPSTQARRECRFNTQDSNPIQTRSITRAAAAAAAINISVVHDADSSRRGKPDEQQDTSVSDSELLNRISAHHNTASHPLSSSQFNNFKVHHKCSRPSLSDDEDCIGAHKRRRLSSCFGPDNSVSHQYRDIRSARMSKLLASIISTDSPLLLALSETVEAEAQAYDVRLNSEPNNNSNNHTSICTLDNLNKRKTTEESPINASLHPTCDHGLPSPVVNSDKGASSSPQLISCKHKPDRSLNVFVDSELPDSHLCCSPLGSIHQNRRSLPNPFTTENGPLPTDLTKPLVVNTELWGRTCIGLTQSNFHQESDSRRIAIQNCCPKENTFRPQTRALTKARLRASSSSNSSMEPSSNHVCTSPLRSIKRSPHPYSPGVPRYSSDSINNFDCKSFYVDEIGLSSTDKPLLPGSPASCSFAIDETKYPTRSSNRRDTLASRSLAQMRTSPACANPAASSPFSCRTAKGVPSVGHSITRTSDVRTPRFTVSELQLLLNRIKEQVKLCTDDLFDEEQKRQMYRIDDTRRVHNYEPFIRAYLSALVQHNMLQQLVRCALQSNGSNASSCLSPTPSGTPCTNNRYVKSTPTSDQKTECDRDSTMCATNDVLNLSFKTDASLTSVSKPSSPRVTSRSRVRGRPSQTLEHSSTTSSPTTVGMSYPTPDDQPLSSLEPTTDSCLSKDVVTLTHLQSECVSNSSDTVPETITSEANHILCDSTNSDNGCSEYVMDVDSACKTSTTQSSDCTPRDDLSNSPVIFTASASYSSSWSSSQSPHSSTSSRCAVYLRPRHSQCVQQVLTTGNISRESLRPRFTTEHSSEQKIGKRSTLHNQSLLRPKITPPLSHNTLTSSRNCKVTNGPGPLSHRVPKRRLC